MARLVYLDPASVARRRRVASNDCDSERGQFAVGRRYAVRVALPLVGEPAGEVVRLDVRDGIERGPETDVEGEVSAQRLVDGDVSK
jgi:hypothetical protein